MSYDLQAADDIQQFTSFAAAINLTDGDTYPAAKVRGHARRIVVNDTTAGSTLQVTLAGSNGTARSLTVADGDVYDGQFTIIGTSTNVTRLTVFW